MKACGSWVIVTQNTDERVENRVILPDGVKGRETPTCRVHSVGEDVPGVKPGDEVFVVGGHHGAFGYHGVTYMVVEYQKVIAVLDGDVN